MTSPFAQDRSHEMIINGVLAQYLRDRCGLYAVAETLREGKQPDIIVRILEGPVVVETEVHPARTVEADALSRLGVVIDGKPVKNVYAVTLPNSLRTVSQGQLLDRMASASLLWQEWREDGTSGPKLKGTAQELGNAVKATTPPTGNLEQAVTTLDAGARSAGSQLYFSPGTLARVAKVFRTSPTDEAANMAALVVINAMVFQDRLASNEISIQPVILAMRPEGFSRIRLLQMWDHILSIDYYPIFSMARDVVRELSDVEATPMLDECAKTAAALFGMGVVGRHDLAGRIFNQLIADRKLLAAFYTSIPAATLLAGLALSSDRWPHVDWATAEGISQFRVVDPACGTGTLLMATYQKILENQRAAAPSGSDDPLLHQALVEQVIIGTDVVQAAIHLTAATLAAMSPSVRFSKMQLHNLKLGMDASKKVWLGSLDWLVASEAQATFTTTAEQVGATGGESTTVQRPKVDLVISNPPYTRRGSDGGKEEAIARLFSLPLGDKVSQQAIARRTSALLKGTAANQIAGHGSSFAVLADRLLNPGGRIAFVLPVTALFGESWRDIRSLLSSRYEIEYVVSSHDPDSLSMSYDTELAETLLVARRLVEGEEPSRRGVFVNLWRAPYRETDALALVRAITATASSPLLRSDGPPVGGNPLIVGGEQWGEMVNGPLGDAPWSAARWKHSLTTQFATALERGELWTEDGVRVVGSIPVAAMGKICKVGPQDRQIRGSLGVFESYHGWNQATPFPAIWSQRSSVHQGMSMEPNAWLVPKTDRDHIPIWTQAGTLHIARDVRYNAQRVIAASTSMNALGVRSWHTLNVQHKASIRKPMLEIALALWLNSTFGLLLHACHSNNAQEGRGQGNKGMLESLTSLDVAQLKDWQLEEAQGIWDDFRDRKFQPFHECAIDSARIELDARIVRDMLGLGDEAVAAITRMRTLLAMDPSIHGSKEPALP